MIKHIKATVIGLLAIGIPTALVVFAGNYIFPVLALLLGVAICYLAGMTILEFMEEHNDRDY